MTNWKSWWMVALCAFALSWIGDWAFMSWMADSNWANTEKWSAMWNMETRNWWAWDTILAYAWFALALTFVFIKGYEGKNWWEGVRFGSYMWALATGLLWITNMMPMTQWWMWSAAMWAGFAVLGAAMWWCYKPEWKTA